MLWKHCTQYASTFGKLSSGHRTGKGQFSFQSQRKAMRTNVQTTVQVCSFHMLAKVMLKILQLRLQQYINQELPDVQAGFIKGRGTREQIASIHWIIKKSKGIPKKKKSTSVSLTTLKPLTVCVDHNKWWKILKEMGIPDYLVCVLRYLYAGQEAIARTGQETMHWFKIGKEVHQGYVLSPAYLT